MIVNLDKKTISCDVKMKVHSPDEDVGVSKYISEHKVWEPFETVLFCELLKNKSFFIDVGANLGYYSLIAAKHFNNEGKVLSLEPDLTNFSLLKDNIALNGLSNINALNLACSDKLGTATIKKSADNYGDHRLLVDQDMIPDGDDYIETTTVDLLIAEAEALPDLIKIDTQGSELSILLGMRDFLDNLPKESVIILEYWPHGIFDREQSTEELLDYLEQFELEILVMFEETCIISQCSLHDLRRWTNTILRPESKQYVNLVLGAKSNINIQGLKEKHIDNIVPFQFNHMHQAVNNQQLDTALIPLGWSFPEESGVWSQDRFAEIKILKNTPKLEGKEAYLILLVYPFLVEGKLSIQRFNININGSKVGEYRLESMEMTELKIVLPSVAFQSRDGLIISFEFLDANSPKEFNQSDDQRLLAVLLNSYGVYFPGEE